MPAVLIAAAAVLVAMLAPSTAPSAPGDTADLRVVKSDSSDPVAVGSVLTYEINVSNLGPQGATEVTLTDMLPTGVDFVSATTTSGTCDRNGRRVVCELSSIANAGEATVTIKVRPTKAGTLTNTATVESVENDLAAANNTDTETTTVREAAQTTPTCRGLAVTIRGTGGDDTLQGTPQRDIISAFGGNDTIYAYAGYDLICAGDGNDRVFAGSWADRVLAGAGADRVFGRRGHDVLNGMSGNDVLRGGRGNDKLRGGRGSDLCRGGFGVDILRSCER
jgi:uncharacterized repeat protein (TIGR01451 family)